jgi:hypothetical protein
MLSITRKALARACSASLAFTTNDNTAPPEPDCCAMAKFMLRVASNPDRARVPLRGVPPTTWPSASACSDCGLHADGQGLHAFEYHPGIEGRQCHAGTAQTGTNTSFNSASGATHGTGHDTALAVEVFGTGVHHQIGTHFNGSCKAGEQKQLSTATR